MTSSDKAIKKGSRIGPVLLFVLVLVLFAGTLTESDPKYTAPIYTLMQQDVSATINDLVKLDRPDENEICKRADAEQRLPNDAYRQGVAALEEGTDEADERAKQKFREALAADKGYAKQLAELWCKEHLKRYLTVYDASEQPKYNERLTTARKQRDLATKSAAILGDATPDIPISFYSKLYIQKIERDFTKITEESWLTVGALILFSLIVGIAGLIYRRAFWSWFLLTFVILAGLNATGSLGTFNGDKPTGNEDLYFFVALQLVLLLLVFRLRWHSNEIAAQPRLPRWLYNSILFGILFFVMLPLLWFYTVPYVFSNGVSFTSGGLAIEAILVLLLILYRTLSVKKSVWVGRAPKNIVACLDGTWNTPQMIDFGYTARTNVSKLFEALKADKQQGVSANVLFDASICKRYKDKQIAFYYSGVGNKLENSEIGQFFGGATGLGATDIVERAYLDVISVYRPRDRIYLFGFSRGAAVARLLARTIDERSAPERMLTLRLLGRHWVIWKS
jgi:hypothetical protein